MYKSFVYFPSLLLVAQAVPQGVAASLNPTTSLTTTTVAPTGTSVTAVNSSPLTTKTPAPGAAGGEYPASGCTTTWNGIPTTCACAATIVAPVAVFVDTTTNSATTLCAATAVPVPTGYKQASNWTMDPWLADPDADWPDCVNNVMNTHTSDCWDKLYMPSYIDWWWGMYKDTCAKANNGKGLGFADCFRNVMTPDTNSQCATLNAGSCAQPRWVSGYKGGWNDVRNFYLSYTIWNLQNFFVTYHQSLFDSAMITSGTISNIVQPIDFYKKKADDVSLPNGADIIAFGWSLLALIPGAEEAEWVALKPLKASAKPRS